MQEVYDFLSLGRKNGAIKEIDYLYTRNCLLHFLGLEDWQEISSVQETDSLILMDKLKEIAGKEADEFFEAELMNFITPLPSEVNKRFSENYLRSPNSATDYFFALSKQNNYIQTRAIAKNIAYTHPTKYGELEITINLSKPEKTPTQIATTKQVVENDYPKCQLCMENEGYFGRANHPARTNHRIVRLDINGENWGFQYSPYAYYNEHAILLNQVHQPMKIDAQTFRNLFAFVEKFPHYMAGSNADLPIVGGSILTHNHYQVGRHEFPMAKAKSRCNVVLEGFPMIQAFIVDWPMSVLRLKGASTDDLVRASVFILEKWKHYSDESVEVRAKGMDDTPHHTITPIARMCGGLYEIDLVLRDNQTSQEHPEGIFHPHRDVQHIKKENIGLIEVMGLAILPPRLKKELSEVEKYCLNQENRVDEIHKAWAKSIKERYEWTAENAEKLIRQEVGEKFVRVLEDVGVFKDTPTGHRAFDRFVDFLNQF